MQLDPEDLRQVACLNIELLVWLRGLSKAPRPVGSQIGSALGRLERMGLIRIDGTGLHRTAALTAKGEAAINFRRRISAAAGERGGGNAKVIWHRLAPVSAS